MSDRSPDWSEVISKAIRSALAEVHTAIPAKVVKFNPERKTADVRILIKDRVVQNDGTVQAEQVPVLTGVPVMFPGGRRLRIDFDLEEGEPVLLIFSERSLDRWLRTVGDTEVDPLDVRFHDRNDCFAIPGISTPTKPQPGVRTADVTYPSIGPEKGAVFVAKEGSWYVAPDRADTLAAQKPVARQTDPVSCGRLYATLGGSPVLLALVPTGGEVPPLESFGNGIDLTGSISAPEGWTPKLKA